MSSHGVFWGLFATAGLSLVGGLTLAAAVVSGVSARRVAARGSLALMVVAAAAIAGAFLINRTIPIGPSVDCSSYPHNGELGVVLAFLAVSAATSGVAFATTSTASKARAALIIGGGELVLFLAGMAYIASANPAC